MAKLAYQSRCAGIAAAAMLALIAASAGAQTETARTTLAVSANVVPVCSITSREGPVLECSSLDADAVAVTTSGGPQDRDRANPERSEARSATNPNLRIVTLTF